jgi:uncharacterized membrane protein YbhN (UPF0104 family)
MSGKRLKNLLRLAFGLCVLAWVFGHLEIGKLVGLARRGDPASLACGVGFLVAAMIGLQWTRLHLLIKHYTPDLATSLKIFFVGALFNNFLPTNIGGDAIRLMYLKQLRNESLGTPFMLLVIYRFSNFALLIVSGFSYVALSHDRLFALLRARGLWIEPRPVTAFAVAIGCIVVCGTTFTLRRRMPARVLAFWQGCRAGLARLTRADALSLLLQSVLFQLCRMLSFYFLVRYMGERVSLWDLVFVISATAVTAALPVTVAGLGVIEASITGLLVMYGVEVTSAGAVALVNRAVMLLSAAIGGVIYLRSDAPAARVDEPEPV